MKLLIISTNQNSPWGGSEFAWFETCKYFAEQGHRVTAVKQDWGEKNHPNISKLSPLGISFVPMQETSESMLMSFLGLKKYDFALIIKGNQLEGVRWMRWCDNSKIPYSTVFHLVTELQAFDDSRWNDLIHFHEKAVMNYFVSNYNLEAFKKYYLYTKNNCAILLNPIDETAVSYVPYPLTDIPTLATVSRLDRFHKGFDILFEALSLIKDSVEFNINIYGDGMNKEYLHKLKQYYGLDMIFFKGNVNNKSEIWSLNQALLSISRMEGLPLSVIEALNSGRVVIGNKQSAIDDIYSLNNDICYKIKSNNVDEIANELNWIIMDNKRWMKKGIIAHQIISEYYSKEKFYRKLNSILK